MIYLPLVTLWVEVMPQIELSLLHFLLPLLSKPPKPEMKHTTFPSNQKIKTNEECTCKERKVWNKEKKERKSSVSTGYYIMARIEDLKTSMFKIKDKKQQLQNSVLLTLLKHLSLENKLLSEKELNDEHFPTRTYLQHFERNTWRESREEWIL